MDDPTLFIGYQLASSRGSPGSAPGTPGCGCLGAILLGTLLLALQITLSP